MSAFVGFVRLDGAAASDDVASAMLGRLCHRVDEAGWDARLVRTDGCVGLGSAVLHATPQTQFEREHPQAALSRDMPDGRALWLVGDVRLDGREALIAELGVDTIQGRAWSDGRLALEAYALWHEAAPSRLQGEFAFAVWDDSRDALFCARDRFGVRPLYFSFVPGIVFAFANEIKALWPALPFAPRPDEAHIADYLAGEFSSLTRTFFEGVERLPPAHSLWLEVNPRSTPLQRRYFSLDASRELELPRDDDYAARVKASFERSVAERSRHAGELSLFLSGGLDSSSVAAVATRQKPPEQAPILALSMVFARFPECDERPWIERNLAQAGGALRQEWVWGDDIGAFHDIERVVWHLDGPPPGPNTCSTWAQYPPLCAAGVRVVLDGHGGDEVVFLGYERVAELVAARRFRDARRELRALRRNRVTDASTLPLLWAQLGQRARGTRFVGRFSRWLSKRFHSHREAHPRPTPPTDAETGAALVRQLVHPDKRVLLPEPAPPSSETSVRFHHAQALESALQPVALEAMDALGGAHALEVRAPFWERELVELCLSLPSDQKLRDGWNRWVMRRAMDGLLPPIVQWRASKTNFAPQMIHGLRTLEAARVESWLAEPGPLATWLDVDAARSLWDELQTLPWESERAAHIAFALWRMLALGAWLRGLEP